MGIMGKSKEDLEDLAAVPSHNQVGEVHDDPAHAHDTVFGEIKEGGPNYRNVSMTNSPQFRGC